MMENTLPDVDRLIPIREAFGLMGLRITRGYAELAAHRLTAIRNGRRTFVRASEVQRYIDSLDKASPPAQGR